MSNPIFSNGIIYFPSFHKRLYAVTEEGRLLWTLGLKADIWANAALHDDVLYLGGRDGIMKAISLEGKLLWGFHANDATSVEPAFDREKIYFGSADGNVYAVVLKDHSLAWKAPTIGPIWAAPAIHRKILLLGNWGAKFYAFNAKDGDILWDFMTSISSQAPFEADLQQKADNALHSFTWTPETYRKEEKYGSARSLNEAVVYGPMEPTYGGTKKEYLGRRKGYR